MNTPIRDFAVTNPTITIYFQFLRFAMIVLIVHFVITGIPVLIYFPQIRKCFLLNCTFETDRIQETYINEKIFKIAQIVNLLFFIVMKYAFLKLLKNFDFLLEMNNQYNKVSDYSVQVRFPEQLSIDNLIKEFNDEKKGYKVVNCNLAYDIRRYTYLLNEIGKMERKIKIYKLKKQSDTLWCKRLEKRKSFFFQQLYKEENRFYEDLQGKARDTKRYRYAYLTFEYKSTVNEIMQELEIKQKKNMKVSRAFEPNDVIWENYGITQGEKFFTRTITVIITFLLSIALYSVIIVIKYYQIKNYDTSFFALIASLMISIIVSIINVVIRFTVSALVKLEKRTSYTIQEHSISIRVSVTYFITNALVIMIAFLFLSKSWSFWEPNGVVVTVTIIMIFGILADGLYDLVHIEYIWKIIKRAWIRYKIKHKKTVFQCEANEAFQGYELDIAERYYQLTKVLSVCFFYQSITPYILLVGIIEVICTYVVQKYTIINRVTRPRNLDFKFSVNQFQNLNFAFYCMIAGQILFEVIFTRKFTTYILIIIIIGVSEYLFDEEDLFFLISPSSSKKFLKEDIHYYYARLEFPSEYDRLNPVTQNLAFQEWLQYLKDFKEKAKKKPNLKQLKQIHESRVFDQKMLKSNLASIQNSMVGYLKQKQHQYREFNNEIPNDSIKINAYQLDQEANNKYREAMYKSAMFNKQQYNNISRNNQTYSINLQDLASMDELSRKQSNSKDLGQNAISEKYQESINDKLPILEEIVESQYNTNKKLNNYLEAPQNAIKEQLSVINSSMNDSIQEKYIPEDKEQDMAFVVSDEEIQALKSKQDLQKSQEEHSQSNEKRSKKNMDMNQLVKNIQITKESNTFEEQIIFKNQFCQKNKNIFI